MDDDSSYVEMIDRYPGPDPAALYLAPILVSSPPPIRPFASTQAPATPYVLHTACLHQSFAASFSAPQNNIMLFDKATLAATRTMSGHTDTVTSLKSVEVLAGTNRRGLISSGKDGRIRIWDERTGSAGAFTVSPDGWTIAAGSELGTDPSAPVPSEAEMDAPIIFWDVRNPTTPKWTHTSTHSDDVTQLDFHPTLGSGAPGGLLLSASADGLLALTSIDEPNEDEAVQFVGNWNTSVAHVGWTVRPEEIMGGDPMNFKIWAASDMQTLSVWSDELALEHDYGDLRRTKIPQTWESDYLINAQWFGYTHTMPWETNALGLWCGNHKGDIGLVSVQDTLSWRLDRVLSGGHTGVVRTCTWDPTSHVLITGGEDSRLNLWSTSNGPTGDATMTPHNVAASPVYSQHSSGYYPSGSVEPRPPSGTSTVVTGRSPVMGSMSIGPDSPIAPGPGIAPQKRYQIMATSCSASVAVPPHKRIDTETTSAIEISGWRLSSTSMPISNGPEVDACQVEVGINAPEMLFGNNALVLEWFGSDYAKGEEQLGEDRRPVWRYEFRAQDALKRVHQGPSQPGDGGVKVGYSEAWLKSRTGPAADSSMPEMVEVKPYDWTYTPVYPGHASVPEDLDNDGFRLADRENSRHEIPVAELQRPDPILFYAEIPLYEDELHDNGLSILTIRIRVMPGSLFVLSRFTLRVDNVLFRNFDTRMYHSFSGPPLVVRDIRGWEAPYKTLRQLLPNPEDLTPLTDPQWIARMLASLPESMTMDKSGKRGTGWKGLGARVEVLELDNLENTGVEKLTEKVDALQVNGGA